jgi:tripartite-type tricarboxylate transporter receptor subunit TctC
LPGFEFYLWQAVLVPAGTSSSVMARLSSAVTATLTHADTKERFTALGAEVTPTTPQQADAYVRSQVERWIKTLKPLAAPK